MNGFYDIADGSNKFIALLLIDNQRWRNLKDHKVISANLRENIFIAKQPHDDHLAEHPGMYLLECLKSNSQPELLRSGKFNPRHQSHATHFLYHLVRSEPGAQSLADVMPQAFCLASEAFALQHLECRQSGSHR